MARRYLRAIGIGCNVTAMTQLTKTKPNGTVYTREQKGHSLVLHILLGGMVLWIPTIYYAISPRHYFHV